MRAAEWWSVEGLFGGVRDEAASNRQKPLSGEQALFSLIDYYDCALKKLKKHVKTHQEAVVGE